MISANLRKIAMPLLWVLCFQAVSALIGLVTRANIDSWYAGLEKSALTPPDIAFPIVWTSLYILIALAGYLSWQKRAEAPAAFKLFVAYTLFNWAWSFIFFHFHLIVMALFWIVAVGALNAVYIYKSRSTSKIAAALMILPLLWVVFAGYLNYMIWVLN